MSEREELTEWMHASGLVHSDAIREWCECQQAADALMPVVDRIANQRAAAELDRVTDIASANWPAARTLIKYRAAALRAVSGEATA